MQVWLTLFLLLFAVVEGCKWLAHVFLPWPVLLIAGALLSVLSNEGALWSRPLWQHHPEATTNPAPASFHPSGEPHT